SLAWANQEPVFCWPKRSTVPSTVLARVPLRRGTCWVTRTRMPGSRRICWRGGVIVRGVYARRGRIYGMPRRWRRGGGGGAAPTAPTRAGVPPESPGGAAGAGAAIGYTHRVEGGGDRWTT